MNISIVAKHVPHEHEIRRLAEEKLSGIDKFFRGRVEDVHIVVDVHKGYAEAEVRVHTGDGNVFVARETGKDVWVALESAHERIKQQLRRHKEIRRKRGGCRGEKGRVFYNNRMEEELDEQSEEGEAPEEEPSEETVEED
ncbi:MAG: ribosome-associated translation inhibitor RaiA [Planctomycetota bacterium]|nr:ribosome-associated translation inhibitor RaiA [Planctomycetota bacterium]